MGSQARTISRAIFLACVTFFSAASNASMVISGTRVIYSAEEKDVTVKLSNVGKSPVLIQSWIDDGDPQAKPENINVPFILTPPINRVDAGKGQTLRLSYTGTALPTDKESVFWLNVLEIPAKKALRADESALQMAFRSRIKLFFRPAGLSGNANEAAKRLNWSATAGGIKAFNPTPYFVSLVSLKANGKEIEGQMIAPQSALEFKGLGTVAGKNIGVEFVNDHGAIHQFETRVK
ncbi:fimbria/pilus periplasmic chaperone [Serratia ureilytica]|uniref:fimbria/pilus periplasmic chaperone n=1 Tax=Serratia ureilytica TaxID=300181 RepID=UPI0018DA1A4B|nr:fimbria/pilus periplasmic chaperone [Serratia ureilytica]MBH3158264.1 fimbria/pilus periplasmic chaperone [Serratia ureilytica]MBH3254128.1 fimbria/pilus periplasmic chaperone [Serratia ureilytica]